MSLYRLERVDVYHGMGMMYFQRQFITEYGPVFAAAMITMLPILIVFLVFRTQIIEGISTTGMKG